MSELEKKIENALIARFPGIKVKFTINQDGSWDYEMLPGSRQNFDDQYPHMTKEQADQKIIEDIDETITNYLPETMPVSYERYGKTYTAF